MESRQYNIDLDLKLRPFVDLDYVGLVDLKNIIYPDHPFSAESLRTRTIHVKRKLNIGAGSGKKTKTLWCPLCTPSTRNLIIPIDL